MTQAVPHKPAILFGLGATKAGTSWLHAYLDGHPDVCMPAVKELHYFDAKFFRDEPRQIARLERERQRLVARAGKQADAARLDTGRRIAKLDRLIGMIAQRTDDAGFARYLTDCAGDARLVGDITPAYALLPARLLGRMQRLAERVRFVYLLRDPVDRLWSHIRMLGHRAAGEGAALRDKALAIFDRWAGGAEAQIAARSDYAGALERMRRALAPENLRICFYERLFSPDAIADLCGFLGIPPRPAAFGQRVHAGVPVTLDPVRAARARALLRPQYDYVGRLFGDLPPRWRENMGE